MNGDRTLRICAGVRERSFGSVPFPSSSRGSIRARELRGFFASSTRDYGGKICIPRCGHVKLQSRVLRLSKDGRRRATMGERSPIECRVGERLHNVDESEL